MYHGIGHMDGGLPKPENLGRITPGHQIWAPPSSLDIGPWAPPTSDLGNPF